MISKPLVTAIGLGTSIATFLVADAANSASESDEEPVKCYRIAWEQLEKGGLGLTAGQAVELCSGAKDVLKVIRCYAQAWEHPSRGGLGLTAGQAVSLCKTSPEPR